MLISTKNAVHASLAQCGILVSFLSIDAHAVVAFRDEASGKDTTRHVREEQSAQNDELDSDKDGLSDSLERRTGTDLYNQDTDSDGVKDGDEDHDRDGTVDPGESNPRRAGLFPGHAPHIPEPVVFDLVRGLGARRGELEVNTLVGVNVRSGAVHWAPEVEWAFADGYAVELELPLLDRELESIKVALQGTLPSPWSHFTHGWQTFFDVGLDAAATDAVLIYIWGQRFAQKWSYLTMLGGKTHLSPQQGWEGITGLLNASIFADVREWQTWGLETNLELADSGQWAVRLFPQVHLQLTEHVRIQLSAGVEFQDREIAPLAVSRIVLE